MNDQDIIESVRRWLQHVVVDMNLCPFAKRELVKDRVRFAMSDAATEDELLVALQSELERLQSDSSIETTLLIHPQVLQDFDDYNQFLDHADALLSHRQWDGVFQVASFHPRYQFAGTGPDDAENYTNRSPYPLLHLLREESIERAVASYPNVDEIPEQNVALMQRLGKETLQKLHRSFAVSPGPTDIEPDAR